MLFVGDIASPSQASSEVLDLSIQTLPYFRGKSIVGNLEGLIGEEYLLNTESPIVYNHESVLEVLKKHGFEYVSLANNHVLDLPDKIQDTFSSLDKKGIQYSGFYDNGEFGKWKVINDKSGQKVLIYTACWDFLLYHQPHKSINPQINTIDFEHDLKTVFKVKQKYPKAKLVAYVHWNFDLEVLPLPIYRKWSKRLIDAGVTLVVGCHSHCVQGAEAYKSGYIVYGLGNFFFPSNQYASGKLAFPEMSRKQLVFEYDFLRSKPIFHWLTAKVNGGFEQSVFENNEGEQEILKYSPYRFLNDDEYVEYYKENRRKSKLVPVFEDYQPKNSYQLKMRILKSRARLARFLAKKGFIKWQN